MTANRIMNSIIKWIHPDVKDSARGTKAIVIPIHESVFICIRINQ